MNLDGNLLINKVRYLIDNGVDISNAVMIVNWGQNPEYEKWKTINSSHVKNHTLKCMACPYGS